jgi:arsenite-transporting ATPase
MAILDTRKAAGLFARYQVPLSGYVVNRVIPAELEQQQIPEFLRHRLEMQKRYLREIEEVFGAEVLACVPEFERDITGIDMIARIAETMFGA